MFHHLTHDLLRQGYAVRFRTPGHSMHPTIRDSETVTVEPIDPRDVRRGDVVLYRYHDRVIAHRVVGIDRDTFMLRGDAARVSDCPVDRSQILGRVVSVERGGRTRDVRSNRLKRAVRRWGGRIRRVAAG